MPLTLYYGIDLLEAMYGLERSGEQQPFALQAGISDDFILTDVFEGGPEAQCD